MKSEIKIERFPLTNAQKQTISLEIEKIKNSCTEYTYIDSIILWCEVNDIDVEEMNKCISETLKRRLYEEAKQSNLVKGKKSSQCSKDGERILGI